jgi:hypothetical protein
MRPTKNKTDLDNSARSIVKKEMAEPRMTRSARIAERNLDTTQTPERPSTAMAGMVDKIIPPSHPNGLERARIVVTGIGGRHPYLHIENILTDENGDDVRLKKGAHVEVTVAAEPKKRNYCDETGVRLTETQKRSG